MKPRHPALALSLAATLTASHARAQNAPVHPPFNVILVTVDSLRGDLFHPRGADGSFGGTPTAFAPRLTALESQSVDYSNAYALSSYTSMSVGGYLAGHVPGEIRRDGYFFGTYPSSVVMLAERLHDAGVRTFAAHSHWYFGHGHAGFDQGFDVYRMVPGIHPSPTTDLDTTGDRQEQIAEQLLGDPANTSGRFFAHFHFMDPHDEYHVHAGDGPEHPRNNRERYLSEVAFTDRQLGRLFDFVDRQPWASRTVIIVSADHGECFGEHGATRHGFQLWEELVHVPWMFRVPGATHRLIDTPRSHLDLAPTVLDLAGVPPASDLPGISLVPEIFGAPAPERDVVVDLPRTSNNDRRRGLVHWPYKIIAYGDDARFDVYDLVHDAREAHPLRTTDRATHDAMVARYRAAVANIHDVVPYACHTLEGAPAAHAH